ncbi:MAG: hypothetical protein ACI8Z5_001250 [Lentimonas sp.]|jgi:hypothetical protein
MSFSGLLSIDVSTNQCFMQEKNIYLRALEAEQSGDWARAHEMVQDMVTAEAAWVHAYLHRVAGDEGNAEYWYNRAVQPVCNTSLDAEWKALYAEFEGLDRY